MSIDSLFTWRLLREFINWPPGREKPRDHKQVLEDHHEWILEKIEWYENSAKFNKQLMDRMRDMCDDIDCCARNYYRCKVIESTTLVSKWKKLRKEVAKELAAINRVLKMNSGHS